MKVFFFDTETTGLPKDRYVAADYMIHNWPDIVSISWMVFVDKQMTKKETFLIQPDGWTISEEVSKIHGITHEYAKKEGGSLRNALEIFKKDLESCDVIVAHNIEFDRNVLLNAYKWRLHMDISFWPYEIEFCTATHSKADLKLPSRQKVVNLCDPYKIPRLDELYEATFGIVAPKDAHSSDRDVDVLQKIFWERWDLQ